jgi:hypothetical protein
LEDSGNSLESHPWGVPQPPKTVTTLVEKIHINNRVIHQVLSDPRKVNQRGYIVEGELSSWSDTRQHQNLYTNVRLEGA